MGRGVIQAALLVLPWALRRRLLARCFGYRIHPTARIGLSIVLVGQLEMGPESHIRSLTVIRAVDRVVMGPGALIGSCNWIFAIPAGSPVLAHEADRRTELLIGTFGGVTSRHLIDCSNTVQIGDYSALVGYGTQVITHQIDVRHARQSTQPVSIGCFCMVGTRSILLGGAVLPDRSMLGAGSTLRTAFAEPQQLYSGVPAQPTGVRLPDDAAYFDPARRHGSRRRQQEMPPV
jgi:acetyltransferase-like isoleucine patch superfamily enzyme